MTADRVEERLRDVRPRFLSRSNQLIEGLRHLLRNEAVQVRPHLFDGGQVGGVRRVPCHDNPFLGEIPPSDAVGTPLSMGGRPVMLKDAAPRHQIGNDARETLTHIRLRVEAIRHRILALVAMFSLRENN